MFATSASLAVAENTKVDPDSVLDHTNQMLAFQGMLNKNCHLEEDSACKALSLKKQLHCVKPRFLHQMIKPVVW